MNAVRSTAVAFVTTLALGALGGLAATAAPANADRPSDEPCAQQQTKVDKATAKLEALTAKWEKNPTKENRKAKKAQVQRVAKAEDRLEECQAEQA